MSAKLVELIETDELRGTGKDGDVFRRVQQWWTKAGELAVERDEWQEESSRTEMLNRRLEAEGIAAILDDQLGKEAEPVGLRTRVLAVAVGCKKWLEHQAKEAAKTQPTCCVPGCYYVCEQYKLGNYSARCAAHTQPTPIASGKPGSGRHGGRRSESIYEPNHD